MSSSVITFENVTKIYDNGVDALHSVSFDITQGEFVFLTGASGSGKSTVLRLMQREEQVTSGNIFIDGENIVEMGSENIPLLRRKYGVVFQDFKLLKDRTVYENVAFAMKVIGMSGRQIRKRIPDVLYLTGITEKAHMYPGQLSGGEQQRVAIARAIVNSPEVILADEPTGNLDPTIAVSIMELFEDINRTGSTILMVTHAKEIVDQMQKRVITLNRGVIDRDEKEGQYRYDT